MYVVIVTHDLPHLKEREEEEEEEEERERVGERGEESMIIFIIT
jgi:hypothetical protein